MSGAITPRAWADRRAFIEVAFPAQKLSVEAQAERKANAGQTLTALGSYWKGRKPLVLARACVLGSLLPATENPEADLEVFELLMAMDDEAFVHRMKSVSKQDVETWGGPLREQLLFEDGSWRKLTKNDKLQLLGRVLTRMPYADRLQRRSFRPEELPDSAYQSIWDRVNTHLGTSARSHSELVEQLGILRFGHRPKVADTFCGGGSIPFEAARLGCDVHASDLNPIACMLTWGSCHVVGADEKTKMAIRKSQLEVAAAVEKEIRHLQIENDSEGNRAKAFLYCLETTCPETGWCVPLAPSWVISQSQRVVASLRPNYTTKSFELDVSCGVTDAEMRAAAVGTVQAGELVFELDGVEHRTPISTIRGDRRLGDDTVNNIRLWEKTDFRPSRDDIFRERLYCIHWASRDGKRKTFFRGVTSEDSMREARVCDILRSHFEDWQRLGLIPDLKIQAGDKTCEPVRTRGWQYWHQLFTPRDLLVLGLWKKHSRIPSDYLYLALLLDLSGKLCQWLTAKPGKSGGARDLPNHVFYNQALNSFYNFGIRSAYFHNKTVKNKKIRSAAIHRARAFVVRTESATEVSTVNDLYITDPPYADAIRYEEITEFFIAWLRKNPPAPFKDWVWDSRRALAIKGKGEDFRREMVRAYGAMAEHMPDNGLQIIMFTHQDTGVWGDMASILWGAGLRVTAAWYIATETTSELKKGGYVQGTVLLIARKRLGSDSAYKDELVLEIREEVQRQIETMVGLNQTTRGHGRVENLFEDVDLQMAGYAAGLCVLTGYAHIDGLDMTREALRPRTDGEPRVEAELIDLAVQIANEYLIPEGLDAKVWERLTGSERFYLRMLDIEAAGGKKLDSYQNFAKAFRVSDWKPLMASMKANAARLKTAWEFKRAEASGTEFGVSLLRAVLYALFELQAEVEVDEVHHHLRDNVQAYYNRRVDVVAVAEFLSLKRERPNPEEASAARVLGGLVRNERLGG